MYAARRFSCPSFFHPSTKRRMYKLLSNGLIGAPCGVPRPSSRLRLQLPVEFIEHEVAEQRRKWAPLRGPLHAWTDQPVLHHPGIQKCSDELPQPLVFDPLGDLPHQFVVIDSIEKLF